MNIYDQIKHALSCVEKIEPIHNRQTIIDLNRCLGRYLDGNATKDELRLSMSQSCKPMPINRGGMSDQAYYDAVWQCIRASRAVARSALLNQDNLAKDAIKHANLARLYHLASIDKSNDRGYYETQF